MTHSDFPRNVTVISSLTADHAGYDISDDRLTATLWDAEDGHFWFRARNLAIGERLAELCCAPPARVLDLGCGSGCVTAFLCEHGYQMTGVDGHERLVLRAADRAPTAEFIVQDLSNGVGRLAGSGYDAACLFDVIEHLDNPVTAIQNAVNCVATGGLVVGTVPALMSLWSDVDVHSGHRLRYSRQSLFKDLAQVRNVSIVEIRDFNRILVPLIWLKRKRSTISVTDGDRQALAKEFAAPGRALNASLFRALRGEQRTDHLLRRLSIPGASLWFALRRTG